jgi:hypothetical protein
MDIVDPIRQKYEALAPVINERMTRLWTAAEAMALGHILRDGVAYQDLGADHFDRRTPDKVIRRAVRRVENLGFDVVLRSVA